MNAVRQKFSTSKEAAAAAADWRIRHDAGLDDAARGEFAKWLKSSHEHANAWREVNFANSMLSRLRENGRTDDVVLAIDRRRRQGNRRRSMAWLAVSLSSAALWMFSTKTASDSSDAIAMVNTSGAEYLSAASPSPAFVPPANIERTGSGGSVVKPEIQTLPDGSMIELRPGAIVETKYTATRRDVRLLGGEAFFIVAKDPERPFVVDSGNVSFRAVGTRFVVQSRTDTVNILVTEGQVSVESTSVAASAVTSSVLMGQGKELSVSTSWDGHTLAPQVRSAEEIEQRLAWRQPRLLLSNTTVGEAVELLNREGALRIELQDASLAAIQLTGACRVDDPAGFVRLLQAAVAVQSRQRADGVIVLIAE